MEAVAYTRFVRNTSRKINQVLMLIRKQPVEKAFEVLSFTPKATSEVIMKTLKSAVANSGRIKNMGGLWVKECWVGQGPALKRMRPGPMGRGMPYKRKMSHVTIVVTDTAVKGAKEKRKKAEVKE